MSDSVIGRDQTNAVNDGCNDLDWIREEGVFTDKVSHAALEAAASGNIHFIGCSVCLSILLT